MTPAQTDALDRARLILSEHFTAWALVMMAEFEENDNEENVEAAWDGGFSTAIGLLRGGERQMFQQRDNLNKERDGDQDRL